MRHWQQTTACSPTQEQLQPSQQAGPPSSFTAYREDDQGTA